MTYGCSHIYRAILSLRYGRRVAKIPVGQDRTQTQIWAHTYAKRCGFKICTRTVGEELWMQVRTI